jgi:hypothetical protein
MSDERAERPVAEPDAVPFWPSIAAGAATAVVIMAAIAWAWWMTAERAPRGAPAPVADEVAGVIMTQYAATGRAAGLAARQVAVRDRWSWVDRPAGVVRAPVDVAIDLYVAGARP